jgi:RNA polymerase sigma-70 factor (ECF subfamily)
VAAAERYVRKERPSSDDIDMGHEQQPPAASDPVLAISRAALPQVYGYLLSRCGSAALAEDLTSETLAAVKASRQGTLTEVSTAWLVGVARHKLVDHWRRMAREQRSLAAAEPTDASVADPWDEWLNAEAAYAALAHLPVSQRAALTLRYLDGLPVADVAEHLGRTLHGTETLLARSRAALRRQYQEGHDYAR